jgi:hypothetical protein
MTDDDKLTIEEWTYAGRRIGSDGKVSTLWIDPSGVELRYSGTVAKHASVGSVFEVHVDRTGGGASVITKGARAPKFLHRRVADDDVTTRRVAKWAALDRETENRLGAEREAKKAGDLDALGLLTLEEARTMMRNRGNRVLRGALLAAVIAYIEN